MILLRTSLRREGRQYLNQQENKSGGKKVDQFSRHSCIGYGRTRRDRGLLILTKEFCLWDRMRYSLNWIV